ncbi:hypothetical protein ZTR_11386 [Talaromyces verruculosus]|nr:hypothetical protein ZTR_11386 [Talaromyces verruculosus]
MMAAGHSEQETIKKLQRASGIADQWAQHHTSVFNHKKYQLIHFMNPRSATKPEKRSITLQHDKTKEAEDIVKYLSVWLDPKLMFEHHRKEAVAKAGVSLEALQGLSGSTWGVALGSMQQIYQAIVIPQMLYGATAWYQPDLMTRKQIKDTIRDFATIQKRAACSISGAFRTTAVEALNVELHLLPIRQQLNQLTKITTIQIHTGPSHGIPSGMLVKRTNEELTLSGYTPMEAHAWKTGGCLTAPPGTLAGQWESRDAYVQAPWHEPPKVVINKREKAISVHNSILKANTHTMVYTDGSSYQRYIGAAAIIPSRNIQIMECIRTESTSTVYAGEACDIKFALKSLLRLTLVWPIKEPVIFLDSQAALKTLQNPRMVSGQEYIRDCVQLLQECKDISIDVTLRWIPGHEGVPGNKAADRAAKKAALKGIETGVLEQFTAVDPNATGTYDNTEEAQQHNQDTGLRTNTSVHADDARTRSAPPSIRTRDNAYTSLGSRDLEPANGDTSWDEDEVVNARVGERSHVGDERGGGGARMRAIDMWDEIRDGSHVGATDGVN